MTIPFEKIKIYCPLCRERSLNAKFSTLQPAIGTKLIVDCEKCKGKSNVVIIEGK